MVCDSCQWCHPIAMRTELQGVAWFVIRANGVIPLPCELKITNERCQYRKTISFTVCTLLVETRHLYLETFPVM